MKRNIIVLFILFLNVLVVSAQNDWNNTQRYAEANSQLLTPPSVVFMGNSITQGWAEQDPDFFKTNNFAGRGIGGQVTAQMLARFRQDVIDLNPKAVVILAGINDIAHNNYYTETIQGIFENIVSMADIARANKIKVVLCTLVAADKIGWRPEIDPKQPVAELNALIRQYAAKNKLALADIFAVTADENGGLKDQYRKPDKDAIHPGLQGYKAMEEEVMKALKKIKVCK